MCFAPPEHHRQEAIRREAAQQGAMREMAEKSRKEAEESRKQLEDRMQSYQAAAEQRQQQVLSTIVEAAKQPIKIKTADEAATPLMRLKQKPAKKAASVSSLRIKRAPSPDLSTNVGAGVSGVNIG